MSRSIEAGLTKQSELDPRVSKALDGIKADDGRTFEEQKRIAQIPSPPFGERARAAYFLQRLREVGPISASWCGQPCIGRGRSPVTRTSPSPSTSAPWRHRRPSNAAMLRRVHGLRVRCLFRANGSQCPSTTKLRSDQSNAASVA